MSVFIPESILGVVGFPLGHSLSPCLHNWALQQEGEPSVFMKWVIAPDNVDGFVAAVRTLPIRGVAVTIPHKIEVMPFLDGMTETASMVGAVNTLFWNEGKLWGENTDVGGFLHPLKELKRPLKSATVLGAGGAARAVVAGLKQLDIPLIQIANRNFDRAGELARDMDCTAVDWEKRDAVLPDLIVNTTPCGMKGEMQGASPWPEFSYKKGMIAYDIVYNPRQTPFLQHADQTGCHVISGLEMFLRQAMLQFKLWTGKDMDAEGARKLLEQELYGAGCCS